jgi:hypothetical protein
MYIIVTGACCAAALAQSIDAARLLFGSFESILKFDAVTSSAQTQMVLALRPSGSGAPAGAAEALAPETPVPDAPAPEAPAPETLVPDAAAPEPPAPDALAADAAALGPAGGPPPGAAF